MTEPSTATQTVHQETGEASSYAPYAQLVKMLVPSSGCIAVYDTSGDLVWCSDGYERPDFRELVEELKAAPGTRSTAGQVRETATGITAYSAALYAEGGGGLGFVVIQLDNARSGAMASSLLRPVLECLAGRIGLERDAARAQPSRDRELDLLLGPDGPDADGSSVLEQLLSHCVESLDCVSGAFLVPEKNVNVVAHRAEANSAQAARLLDRTQKHLLAWAQLNNRPMVVNRIGTDAGTAPYKILSCPVRDPQSRVSGLMALFRSGEAPNFEVRDVRILDYVCRKAMGILHSEIEVLTGLTSPLVFERRVRMLLETEPAGRDWTMLYLDIDRLQAVNDAFGFHAGDEVIKRLAELIRGRLGPSDLACRIGGDRFAVFVPGRDVAGARGLAEELVGAMANLGYLNGAEAVPVSVSVGLATTEHGERNFAYLLAAAEVACKRAQVAGRGRVEAYAGSSGASSVHDGDFVAAANLRQALQAGDLRLQAQAIVDLYHEPGKVLGYEILVRLRDAAGSLISPDKFVRAAERYDLMPAVDKWVVAAAIKALEKGKERLSDLPLGIAINIAGQTLMAADFPGFVLEQIGSAGLPPEAFCFELNEAAAASNLGNAERFIRTVTGAGCHVSLDDFGSGLSSLAHLKRLKVSYLKIDGNLVRRVLDDIHAESLVRGLVKAAQTLGILTVAEHVESAVLAEKLRELEVDLAQGYHFARPAPLAQAIAVPEAPSPAAVRAPRS